MTFFFNLLHFFLYMSKVYEKGVDSVGLASGIEDYSGKDCVKLEFCLILQL